MEVGEIYYRESAIGGRFFFQVTKVTECYVTYKEVFNISSKDETRCSKSNFYYMKAPQSFIDEARIKYDRELRTKDKRITAYRKIESFYKKVKPQGLTYEQNQKIVETLDSLYWDLYQEDL